MRILRATAAPLLGLLAAAALLVLSRGLDALAREGQLGPGFWPRLALVGLGLACAARLVQAWPSAGGGAARAAAPTATREPIAGGKLVAAVALILLYVVATPVLGFALATLTFIVLFLVLGGRRSRLGLCANAVGGTVVLLYVFLKVVYLPLPKGTAAFETLTLVLYRALRVF